MPGTICVVAVAMVVVNAVSLHSKAKAGYSESRLHQAAGLVDDKGRICAPGSKLSFFSSKTSEETRSATFCLT